MNAVWNSYGQLCGCPEIFKKSCKFFCRGLDIRVSNIKQTDIREIAEIFVDKRYAGKTVEEMEAAEQVTIFLILREDLSILPQKDTMLKLNDIIVIRGENP